MTINNKSINYSIIDFKVFGDENGSLIPIEKGLNNEGICPFDIKRIYYIYGTKQNFVRGLHSHKKLQQIIICLVGSCDFILDNGYERKKIHLNDKTKGLYIGPNTWREFTNFSKDCVIVVIASEYYDESDYIRNYDDFIKSIKD